MNTSSNFTVRKAQPNDFESVFVLLKQLWPNRRLIKDSLQEVFIKGIDSEEQFFLLAISERKVVGIGTLSIRNSLYANGNLAHIDELVVEESYRGSGIGKKLLEEMIKISREKACTLIELDSAFHREEAHRFYEREGFEKTAFVLTKKQAVKIQSS